MEDYHLSVGYPEEVAMEDYELSVITERYHLSVGYPEEVTMEDYELSVITGTLSFVCRLSRGGGNGRL